MTVVLCCTLLVESVIMPPMKYWEIVADKLSAAGWSRGYCSAVTRDGWRWIVDARHGDGRRSFPATFTNVAYTATQSGGASGFTASGSSRINDTVVMPSGSKITYKATGTISASANSSISNTVTVTAPSGVSDPNLANNTATDTDTL